MQFGYPTEQPRNGATQNVAPATSSATAVVAPQPQHPNQVMEDLGSLTIQGVEAHGRRWTTTIPAGAIGNDQTLVQTEENWYAAGLGINVRSMRDDPLRDRQTVELVKLDQGEPDPALFQPPEGYEVVTEEMVPCKETRAQ